MSRASSDILRGFSRSLYDLAHTFESADEADVRIERGLSLLREMVGYEHCAVLTVPPRHARRLTIFPAVPEAQHAALMTMLHDLLELVMGRRETTTLEEARARGGVPRIFSAHLAVPLVSLDQVIGLLFVGRDGDPYDEDDLRLLSVTGAQMAAYLTTVQLHKEKDEFLAMLSHELRSPLTTIHLWAEMLAGEPTHDAESAQAAAAALRSTRAMSRLIEDLLDVSRVAAGKLRLELRALDPAQIVQAVVSDAAPTAAARGITLVWDIDRTGTLVNGDAERLRQVVSNLVGNAIKFTPRGGQIEVRYECRSGHVRIQVKDSGKGLSPALIPEIFERFRQAEASSRRGSDGLGLGLSIVRSLVDLHGGRVQAESAGLGKGATFTVILPAYAPAP